MIKRGVLVLALLTLACEVANSSPAPVVLDPPLSASPESVTPTEVPLLQRAHVFFLRYPFESVLPTIVSEQGVARLLPEIAALRKEWFDAGRLVPEARKTCALLRNARSALEMGRVLAAADEAERMRQGERADQVLSTLDAADRHALEGYIDARLRPPSFNRTLTNFEAAFQSLPFPSPTTEAVTERTCRSAAELEAKFGSGA